MPLAVLIVEDVESDAQFIARLFKKANYELVYELVETAAQMRAALEKQSWDVVISDYSLPQFDGRAALNLLREMGRDIPFIVVSGTIGEESAVAMMKAGAHDYLVKGDLMRLVPAVERELGQAQIRWERKQADDALRKSEEQHHAIIQTAMDGFWLVDTQGHFLEVNETYCRMSGYSAPELMNMCISDLEDVETAEQTAVHIQKVMAQCEDRFESRQRRKDGSVFDVEVSVQYRSTEGGRLVAFLHDITERKRADEKLRESENRFRTMADNSPVLIWMSGLDKLCNYFNKGWLDFSGRTMEQELGNGWTEGVHGDDLERCLQTYITAFDARENFEMEYRMRRHDGEFRWIVDIGVPRYLPSGEFAGYIGSGIDITGRKRAEDALRASETSLKFSQRVAHVGHWTWDTVLNRVIWSDEMYRIFGVDQASFDGDLSKVIAQAIHPDDRKKVNDSNNTVLTEQKSAPLEYRVVWRDGSVHTVWAEAGEKVVDANGEILKLSGIVQDITDRKRAEERYRLITQNAEDIIWAANMELRLTYVSPSLERALGYAAEELMGLSPEQLLTAESLASGLKVFSEEVAAAQPQPNLDYARILEMEYRRKDGSTTWVEMKFSFFRDPVGQLTGILGVGRDVTERKRAEEALRESERLLAQAESISHAGSWEMNLVSQDVKWSDGMYNLFQVPRDAADKVGTVLARLHPDDLEGYKQLFGNLLAGNVVPHIEHRVVLPDGGVRHIWAQASVERAVDGKPARVIGTAQDITERKQAEEGIRLHIAELEMLYQSGLTLNQLLDPKTIGQKILELLEEKLGWHHTRIRLYHPQDDSLELLDFNRPGLTGEAEKHEAVERFQTLITRSGQGMSGWVIQHGRPARSGDVNNDPRYVEAYHGIHSGLYVPMKLSERIIGVISIEDERPDAFSEADERLIVTLANQAASAFENARLFEETRQRVMELETLNRISIVLRAVSKQDEMLAIVLDEALAILNTSHGYIALYNKTTDCLEKTITRGWVVQVVEPPQHISEGIAGKVFTSGETYISREFASDPATRAASRSQIPLNWGGISLPIRTTQQTLGVMTVSVPSERELDKDEIRLLSILSEMTGAALQRMQLHEQTVRHLEQLSALRAVDQAISSSLDMRLTLNILLTHTVSQLNVDAADVLLLRPGSTLLELVAGYGFHTLLLESVSLSDSIAGRAIREHRSIMTLDFESAMIRENPQFGKFWRSEGFVYYWCVPLIIKGEVKGVLEVYRRTASTPDAEWLEFLETLASQAAIAIDNTQLFENLQRVNLELSLAYDATIEGWSRALDLRDHETEGHTLRVTDLTLNLARAININKSQLTAIRRGALLHDIGKMGVPDSILLKDGELTEEEWAVMRTHPQLARDLLTPIAYLNNALDIPYCHHEKWDGTGYPQGLKGDRIPLTARIFAIVDVWDALTNDRPYRKKWTRQKALRYIKQQSGRHFDPQVVDIFLDSLDKKMNRL